MAPGRKQRHQSMYCLPKLDSSWCVIKWKHFPHYWSLCGEITGHRWISHTEASDGELWCFLWIDWPTFRDVIMTVSEISQDMPWFSRVSSPWGCLVFNNYWKLLCQISCHIIHIMPASERHANAPFVIPGRQVTFLLFKGKLTKGNITSSKHNTEANAS